MDDLADEVTPNERMSDEEYLQWFAALARSISVRTLYWDFPAESFQNLALAVALAANRSLSYVRLRYSDLGLSGWCKLANFVKYNKNLLHLEVSSCNLDDAGLGHLCDALLRNETLTTLIVDENVITQTEGVSLARLLQSSTGLTALSAKGNPITSGALSCIMCALVENYTLTSLALCFPSSNDPGIHFFELLAPLSSSGCVLTFLDLSMSSIDCLWAKAVAAALCTNQSLTVLNLGDNSIRDSGCAEIANMIQRNQSLTKLDLSCNMMTKVGCTWLLNGFRRSKSLLEIVISNSQYLCASDLADLAKVLVLHRRLFYVEDYLAMTYVRRLM
jgi:Ran GTPase-activating protein (RanGAP) involved in mRNA processing and transport